MDPLCEDICYKLTDAAIGVLPETNEELFPIIEHIRSCKNGCRAVLQSIIDDANLNGTTFKSGRDTRFDQALNDASTLSPLPPPSVSAMPQA